jgi:hypothetical protein
MSGLSRERRLRAEGRRFRLSLNSCSEKIFVLTFWLVDGVSHCGRGDIGVRERPIMIDLVSGELPG